MAVCVCMSWWWVVLVAACVHADVVVELEVQNVTGLNASVLQALANASSVSQAEAVDVDVESARGVVVELEVDGVLSVNASAVPWSLEQAPELDVNVTWTGVVVELLADGVSWVNLSVLGPRWPASEREDVTISTRPIRCAAEAYLDTVDGVCLPCSQCGPGEAEVRGCVNDLDRICRGSVEVELAVDGVAWVNISRAHLDALEAILTRYLYWNFTGASEALERENVTLAVRPYACGAGRYLALPEWACAACAVCGPQQYASPACLGSTQAVCHNCSACGPPDVLVRACGDGADAVCRGFVEIDLDVLGSTGAFDVGFLEHILAVQVCRVCLDAGVGSR